MRYTAITAILAFACGDVEYVYREGGVSASSPDAGSADLTRMRSLDAEVDRSDAVASSRDAATWTPHIDEVTCTNYTHGETVQCEVRGEFAQTPGDAVGCISIYPCFERGFERGTWVDENDATRIVVQGGWTCGCGGVPEVLYRLPDADTESGCALEVAATLAITEEFLPVCTGRECGSLWCRDFPTCGYCDSGSICTEQGRCAEPEVCDGVDNDEDGETDENLLNACGECGDTPSEVCDGLDNNCNGEVDEELARSCATACGVGEEICREGEWVDCTAPPTLSEICDGFDNDCDFSVDEGCPVCGNGIAEGDEECDGDDLGGNICDTLGLTSSDGALACDRYCRFDTSQCLFVSGPVIPTVETSDVPPLLTGACADADMCGTSVAGQARRTTRVKVWVAANSDGIPVDNGALIERRVDFLNVELGSRANTTFVLQPIETMSSQYLSVCYVNAGTLDDCPAGYVEDTDMFAQYHEDGAINVYDVRSTYYVGLGWAGGWGYYPPVNADQGAVVAGVQSAHTFLQEIGHYLGLMHTFEDALCDTPDDPGPCWSWGGAVTPPCCTKIWDNGTTCAITCTGSSATPDPNPMDYYSCSNGLSFTAEQGAQVRCILDNVMTFLDTEEEPPSCIDLDCNDDNSCTVDTCMDGVCGNTLIGDDCGSRVCGSSTSGCYSCGICPAGRTCNSSGRCICTPSWSCTGWSACSCAGTQTRTCTDANLCGTTEGRPALTIMCNRCGNGACDCAETCTTCPDDCGACPPVCVPVVEICNELDDDCDGVVDDGVRNACGACGSVPAEICDGADNNCDGTVDEGLTQFCTNECGNSGTRTCFAGSWSACSAAACPPPVFCGDGICNGTENCSSCSVDCGGVCTPGATETDSCDDPSPYISYCGFEQTRTCTTSCTWGSWACEADTAYNQYGVDTGTWCGTGSRSTCITLTSCSSRMCWGYFSSPTGDAFTSTDAFWRVEGDDGTILVQSIECGSYAGRSRVDFSFPTSRLNLTGSSVYRGVRGTFWGGNDCVTNLAYTTSTTWVERCY